MAIDPQSHPDAELGRGAGRRLLAGLVGFEALLYAAVGLLLAAAAVLVLVGTVHELAHGISTGRGAVDTAVNVLDRVLLTLIIAELVYTLRFVLRTHEIAVEPFLFIGLIAVVRRILIVTAQFERPPAGGRALTNLLLELGLLGFLALALSAAVYLVRRGRSQPGGRPAKPADTPV
ncbi:MAG: phosphate-starvation-inducible PsiE family protein [Gaiellaceae bacterium]